MDDSAVDFCPTLTGCNYCEGFFETLETHNIVTQPLRSPDTQQLIDRIKSQGRGKKYDCVVGVSGGADSSWALVNAVKLGLRPLAVHMDNGWNTDLAVSNIHNLITKLGVDLHTEVLDWSEYRRLMEAFCEADVVDIELLYDNAMLETCFRQARNHGVKAILSGGNHSTEGFRIPPGWNWRDKNDGGNIRAIARWNGAQLKSFPLYTNWKYVSDYFVRQIRWISFLDYLDYNKENAVRELTKSFGCRAYPYKHYENFFTRFYQGFLLPKKFGVDKRLPHLSALVCTSQLTRDEALEDLARDAYPSARQLEDDQIFFLKKMKWDEKKLADYLQRPPRFHDEWYSETKIFDPLKKIFLERRKKARGAK